MKNKVLKLYVIALSLIAIVWLLPANANNWFFSNTKMDFKNGFKYWNANIENKINSNIELVKSNLNLFLEQNSNASWAFVNLDATTKAQITTTTNNYIIDLNNLKTDFSAEINASGSINSDVKKEYNDKLTTLSSSYYNDIKALVSSDPTALAWVEDRKDLALKNYEDKKNSWKDWKNNKKDMVSWYKERFASNLNDRLEKLYKLYPEKVEKSITRIDQMIANYEANITINAEVKAKIIAQLTAIKELMQDLVNDLKNQ
jgi:hypothetical protein